MNCVYCGADADEQYVHVLNFYGITGWYCLDCYGILVNHEMRKEEYAKILVDAVLNGRYEYYESPTSNEQAEVYSDYGPDHRRDAV